MERYRGAGEAHPYGCLSVGVHVVVVFHVVAAGDIVHPFLVVEIPADGTLNAFLELETGFPTQFALQFGAVDGVAHVVSGTVGDKGDEVVVG